MPETLNNLWYGFSIALTWENFLYSLAGAALGTLVGVLPGFGPVTAMALLLPLTFKMSATGAVIAALRTRAPSLAADRILSGYLEAAESWAHDGEWRVALADAWVTLR